ncbi:hypothetical protein HK096_001597, partial [Nowakowskiella sp. JEL0078]
MESGNSRNRMRHASSTDSSVYPSSSDLPSLDPLSVSRSSSASFASSPPLSPRVSVSRLSMQTPNFTNSQQNLNSVSQYNSKSSLDITPPFTPPRPGYSAPLPVSSNQQSQHTSIQIRRRAPSPHGSSKHSSRRPSEQYSFDESKSKPFIQRPASQSVRRCAFIPIVITSFSCLYLIVWIFLNSSKSDITVVSASELEIRLSRAEEQLVRAKNELASFQKPEVVDLPKEQSGE